MKQRVFIKALAKFLSLVMVLSLLANLVVLAEPTDEYGSYDEGITGDALSLEATPNFENGDFEDGLRYWGNGTRKGKASDAVAIDKDGENSYLLIDRDEPVNAAKGVRSVPFKVDGLQVGDEIIVAFDYKVEMYDTNEANNSFYLNITTLSKDTAFERNLSVAGAKANSDWGTTTGSAVLSSVPEGGEAQFYVYTYLQFKAACKIGVDNIKIVIRRNNGDNKTPDGYYEQLDGELIAEGEFNPSIYGTEADGMYDYGYNVSVNEFKNGDFSNGLKFWGSNKSKKYASEYAAYKTDGGNGYLEIDSSSSNGLAGITSAAFPINGLKTGDKLVVLARYKIGEYTENKPDFRVVIQSKNTSIATISAHAAISNARPAKANVYYYYEENGWATAETAYSGSQGTVTILSEEATPEFYVEVTGAGANSGKIYVDDIKVCILRSVGTDQIGVDQKNAVIAYETTEGVLLNKDTLYPLYGKENTGMYHYATDLYESRAQKMMTAEDVDVTDFSTNGLKYWGPWYNGNINRHSQIKTYASDYITQNEDGSLSFKDTGIEENGIASVNYKLPEKYVSQSEKVVMFEYKMEAEVGNLALTVGFGNGDNLSNKAAFYRKSEWTFATVPINSIHESGYGWIAMYTASETETQIRGLSIGYKDIGGIENLYVNADGTPYMHEMGDANADNAVNILDLVRIKKYIADSENNTIYFAAANFDNETSDIIDSGDLISFRQKLLKGK